MAILRCKTSFAAVINGAPKMVPTGTLLKSTDPLVKGREDLFEDVETHVTRHDPVVEKATAEPGEKRSLTGLARRATGRAAAKKTAPAKKAAAAKKTAAKPEQKKPEAKQSEPEPSTAPEDQAPATETPDTGASSTEKTESEGGASS